MGPLVLIASMLLFLNHQQSTNGYELSCGPQFLTISPQQRCTLRNATQYELDSFGVAGIPDGALLEILNPEINTFDEGAFLVVQKAHNLTFSRGIVKNIVFQSSTLVSLKVFNSWLVRFKVVEEDNFSLKTLSIKSDKYRIISPTIRYLKGLEELTFQKCSLEFIDFEPFTELEKLRLLDLSWNKIHSVRIDPSVPLAALKSLDMSYNKLSEMHNFPQAFPALKVVSLKRNSWYCDWVSEARGNIWTSGVTVMGAESYCGEPDEDLTNNGGLCCRERPKHLDEAHSVLQDVLDAIQVPSRNNKLQQLVVSVQSEDSTNPTVLIYNLI
uniref:Putative conserved secreted protein n=1 Tax=Culex tarsalis TaxID=7177 RepID=A0A1Q3FRX9_CULTA